MAAASSPSAKATPPAATTKAPTEEERNIAAELAAHHKHERLLAAQPWRRRLEECEALRTSFFAIPREDLCQAAADRCKNSMLTEEEVIQLTYTLYCGPTGQTFYNAILLNMPWTERVEHHNWYVADRLGNSFIDQHGRKIETLKWPLFPPDQAYSSLNLRLLTEPIMGAGPQRRPAVYKEPTGGAYTVPVVTDARGAPYVELTPVEDAFTMQQRRVAALERQMELVLRDRAQQQPSPKPKPKGKGKGGKGSPRGGQEPEEIERSF